MVNPSKKSITGKSIETIFTTEDCKNAGSFPSKKRQWRLKIDCTHCPPSLSYDSGWIWAKDFNKAIQLIKLYGFPVCIVFGVIHNEKRSMSHFARSMVKWSLETNQHMHGKPEFLCTSSVHWLEQAKIAKALDLWLEKAYNS